jgi:amino acid adenylation domain-containing protein
MIAGLQETCPLLDSGAVGRAPELAEKALPAPNGVHQLFEAQALRSPDATALVFNDQQLSYRALNRCADAVSRALKERRIKAGDLIGVCAERGAALAAGVLGVLKAGAAYVPLEPSLPDDRLRTILDDACPAALLAERGLLFRLNGGRPVICINEIFENSSAASAECSCGPSAGALAYVIYTSGTTGKPKGVMIEHRSLMNHCQAMAPLYGLGPADRVLQFASFGFDVAAEEMFPTWASGATLVMWASAAGFAPIRTFVDFIDRAHITVLNLPAPFWHEWVAELDHATVPPSIRLVVVGSDAVLADKVAAWQKHTDGRVRLINAYGPTEATITATTFEVPAAAPLRSVPIGRPIANVKTYVLDEHRNPVMPGSAGELYLGGAGVARGYLNQPEQSAASFCADPFDSSVGGRLYRTGDQARVLADGHLEFLGRLDDQVKIRGVRVETGEIEALLRGHVRIRSAVVVAREDEPGNRTLVAYVVGRNGTPPPARELRRFVHAHLPHYMVPQAFVALRGLPLTTGGKIDRRRLPAPRSSRAVLGVDYVAPRGEIEAALVRIWETVLSIRPVGVRDDFFELAGDSLLLVRMAAHVERRLKVNLALTAFLQAPTVEALARVVAGKRQARSGALICPYRVHGARPPLFCHGGSDDLARLLGPDQPIYWLDPHGMNGGPIPETIERMAAEYLDELCLIQPRGPYWLLGYSFGGLVMLELARLLMARGEAIGLLVLVDPSAPPNLAEAARQSLLAPERRSRASGATHGLEGACRWTIGWLTQWRRTMLEWVGRSAVALGAKVPPSLRLIHFAQGCDSALRRYRASVYPGSFVLFRRPDNLTEAQWRALALHPIDLHDSWIDHNDFLERPYVQQICRQIDQRAQVWSEKTAAREECFASAC